MPINKYVFRTGLVALSLLIISLAGVAAAVKVHEKRSISLKDIDRQCNKRLDSDGFGHASVQAGHIKNEIGQIAVPCKVTLNNGASLQLTNVRLKTKNLVVQTKEDSNKPVHIIINKSTLESAEGGFQVQLKIIGSTISINESRLDYPLSLGVSVGSGDDDMQASLRVTNSQLLSNAPDSEGTILVSSGKAIVKDTSFSFADPESQALLLGSECQLANNKNANNRCHGP